MNFDRRRLFIASSPAQEPAADFLAAQSSDSLDAVALPACREICCGEPLGKDELDYGRRFDDLTSGREKISSLIDLKLITQALRAGKLMALEDEVLSALLENALWERSRERGGLAFVVPEALREELATLHVLLSETGFLTAAWQAKVRERAEILERMQSS